MRACLFPSACFLLLCSLAACGPDHLYKNSTPLAAAGWTYRDSTRFEFQVPDTVTRYDIFLDVEYTAEYPFQNLYLKLSTRYPNGKQLTRVKSIDLFDNQGHQAGQSAGGHYRLQAALQENAYFNQTGPHTVSVGQYTRRDTLPGMVAMGLLVQRRQ